MKRNSFFLELIKSGPFIFFMVLATVIILGVVIAKHREKVIQMREDVLYVQPKPAQ
jgi:hypothetical protein